MDQGRARKPMKNLGLFAAVLLLSLWAIPTVRAEEPDKLAAILIPGEDWQIAIQGIGFADGLSCDVATGSIYFSDMKPKDSDKPGIYLLSATLEKKRLFDGK